jgi:hypothetical protein
MYGDLEIFGGGGPPGPGAAAGGVVVNGRRTGNGRRAHRERGCHDLGDRPSGGAEPLQVDRDVERADLVEAARTAKRRGWWDEARYRDHATHALLTLIQFESHATAIRVFYPSLIDGLLQTPRYAEALFDYLKDDLSPDVRAARTEIRMRRQAEVLSRPDPPDILFLLDESILYRAVGGPQVLSDQLQHLLDLTERRRINVRVVPMTVGVMLVMVGGFSVLDLDDGESSVLYRELMLDDRILEGEEVANRYRSRFEEGWSVALKEDASRQLIESRRTELLSSLNSDSTFS